MSDEEVRADKFTAPAGAIVLSQCAYCTHLSPGTLGGPGCKAFPGGIPDAVLTNRADHRKPIDGDDGVRLEARQDITHEQLAALFRVLDAIHHS